MMKDQTQQVHVERMLRVLVYIQNHLDEELPLDKLAAVAHFSPFHFHRIFRGMVGESVAEHVRRLRIERAAFHLKVGEKSVTHIALDAGYETHEAFTRAFRSRFDQSPTQFRQTHKALRLPDSPAGVHFAPDGKLNSFTPLTTGDATMDIRLEKLEPKRVAFMRHTGPYTGVGPTWAKLCAWAGPKGLIGPNFAAIGMCHDDPEVTPPDKIRYDACMVVGDQVEAEGDVGIQTIPGGDYVVATHKGPYE